MNIGKESVRAHDADDHRTPHASSDRRGTREAVHYEGRGGNEADKNDRPLARRVAPALLRRVRLFYVRLRHRHIRFDAGCDVRRGFWVTLGQRAIVSFGPRCILDRYLNVECHGKLAVGAGTIFGHHCTIGVQELVEIGRDCLIAEMVSIRDHDHRFSRSDVPVREQGMVVAPVRIGDNVWLGSKVTVTKGVTIGDNAIVGANAVVTRDIPPNAIAAGVPARVLGLRGRAAE
jgi:acetyltransferase-like isoleucine patch superfamily enzyme